MFTQCPHCDTVFRVSAEQLRAAQGRVRCGQCQGVFDALAHLYDQAPEPEPPAPTGNTPTVSSWDAEELDDTPHMTASRDEPEWSDTPAAANATPEAGTPEEAEPAAEVTDSPVAEVHIDIQEVLRAQFEAPAPPAPARSRTFAWSLLALLLLLGLCGQYVYVMRATLAQYEPVRPWLQRLCGITGCELPLRRAVDRIELMNRDVISHPRIRDALLVTATFVNRAPFVQPYPVLQVILSNENGAAVAMRRFQPEEYLAPGVAVAAGMTPGTPVHVVLELAEPRHRATSFQFDFL